MIPSGLQVPERRENLWCRHVVHSISLIQGLLPLLRERKAGTIFNFSSIAGVAGNPPFGAYNASKAALEGAPGAPISQASSRH